LGLAKQHNITIILIGHITKDGQLAGPKSLEHIVDTVIYLETDSSQNYRLLRATKNRFGSINEIGIFAMTGAGFEAVSNSSAIFLEQSETELPGSVISAVTEGTRPFLVEIQALVTKTIFGYPQRKSSGFDANRLQVLSAVMAKRSKINLMTQDIILNMVGGLKINDPGLDLAVCLAISSSMLNKAIKRDWLVLGEVGLGGEIRPVARLDDKLRESEKLGFTTAIIPDQKLAGKISLKTIRAKDINEALSKMG
jgi:DNA repair protein RadA/Sms